MSDFTGRVWVKPGARRPRVGGVHGEPPALVVAVAAPAAGGAANEAVRRCLAGVLGVRVRQVSITRGHRSRAKTVTVSEPPADLPVRWAALLSTVG